MADLSLSKQCDIVLKAEEIWEDSQNQREMYMAEAESIKTLVEMQAPRTQIRTQIENPDLEADTVKVVWLDNCDDALDDNCQDVCDFTGNEVVIASKDYNLTACKSASFSIDENDLLRNRYTLEEVAAKTLLSKTKALDEYFNVQSLLFLSANAGYNSRGTMTGTTKEVAAADYTTELLIQMVMDAKYNKFSNPFVLDGGELWESYLRADLERGNSDGDGAFQKKMLFKTGFDVFGFANAGISENTFLINPGSYAFATRNYFDSTPTNYEAKGVNQVRYTIPSRNIAGLAYDVIYEKICSGHRTKHVWYIEKKWGFLLNPEGCDIKTSTDPDPEVFANRTGILSYTKTA